MVYLDGSSRVYFTKTCGFVSIKSNMSPSKSNSRLCTRSFYVELLGAEACKRKEAFDFKIFSLDCKSCVLVWKVHNFECGYAPFWG